MNLQTMIDWLNQNQGFALTLLTFIYVIATIIVVVAMMRANRLTAESIDTVIELEKQRTRPSVIFHVEISRGFVVVSLKNLGLTTAFDVRIALDQKLVRDMESHEDILMLTDGVASLPPNAEIRTIVAMFRSVQKEHEEMLFTGKVTYHDAVGNTYEEPFKSDLSTYEDQIRLHQKGFHDLVLDFVHLTQTGRPP